MIKIKEEEDEGKENKKTSSLEKIHVTLENNEEKIFDNYPISNKIKVYKTFNL